MPDKPTYAKHAHPVGRLHGTAEAGIRRHSERKVRYAELQCKSNFSFLRGASHPEELAEEAAKLGYAALAITDHNTLAGVVRMHCAAKACNLKLIVGAEITPVDAPPVIIYATDRAAYGRLCRIITQGHLCTSKGSCAVTFADIAEWNQGLIAAISGCGSRTVDCRLPIANSSFVASSLGGSQKSEERRSKSRPEAGGRTRGAPTDCGLEALSPASIFSSVPPSLRPFVPTSGGDAGRYALRRGACPPRGIAPSLCATEQDWIHAYRDIFGDRLYLCAGVHGGPDDDRHLAAMDVVSRTCGVPLIATNNVHYHEPGRRFLQDVLTCVREHCTLEQAGQRLFANAERHLKPIEEMQRLFAGHPGAIARTVEIADRCGFSLDELRYEYPEALCPPDRSAHEYLSELTRVGAKERYPQGVPGKVFRLIEHELKLIRQLEYEPYFLTVWDIVKFARSRGILCQGRGSAANSAVCYCLGITSVDPDRIDLLFERFVSAERNEPPDIDVDFEHERREEVFQYIYNKYGRDHAGIVAEVITYRPRSAIRDVGKALGLSLDHVDALAKKHEWWDKDVLPEDFVRETGIDPSDRTVRMLGKLVRQLIGFPRHLSQHVGGFVVTRGPLCEMVPIENAAMPDRTFIEWDKDDIDALGILKIDCLALGMLTAIGKCLRMINAREEKSDEATEEPPLLHRSAASSLTSIPPEDPAVYDMICRADTVGVFQIESRAQMSMLPRLRPRCFYDLVIEVAIVRPGPIQGNMVHPYLRRRSGEEPVSYPSAGIKEVLRRTLGVPLFQEQAMRLAVVAAGFTPGEADQLRRAMGAWRRGGEIERFREKLITGMKGNGLCEEFAQRCFEQISGFGEYGFPESHAASFALLVYVSAWLKRYHPAAFCAAIINSQPMGFYQPAQLVRDAREHGVRVLPVDVNRSGYDCGLEEATKGEGTEGRRDGGTKGHRSNPQSPIANPQFWGVGSPAVRLGMRLIKGISHKQVEGVERACQDRPFTSVTDLAYRSGAARATLARLAAADAMQSLGLDRRQALWEVLALGDDPPLFEAHEPDEPQVAIPPLSTEDAVLADYANLGLSLNAHPVALVRNELNRLRIQTARVLKHSRKGQLMKVAGLVLVRQRPGTAKGIVFCTLEDETGTANLIIRPAVYQKYRRIAHGAVALVAEGRVERQGEVVHLQTTRVENLTNALSNLRSVSRDFH